MKHLKTFENFRFVESNEYPSAEEMKAHLCDCGYTPEECDEMSYEEICSCWEECNMMNFESKKEGTKPKSKKEKELAAKYPPKDKITRGDFITAAKENADKKDSKSKGLSAAQKKLPAGLQKAILKKKK